MIACSGQQVGKMYGGNQVFEQLSFEIHEKDRVGLVGRNGSGKTTLFKLLAGLETPDSGQIHWKKGCEIGYLAQIPNYPNGMKAIDILKSAFADLLEINKKMKQLEKEMGEETNEGKLTKLISEYGELQEQFSLKDGYEMDAIIDKVSNGLNIAGLLEKDFNALSGGEKTKICLGHMLLQNPTLLLLDEPTNHLDIKAVEWLAHFLKDYDGTVVLISHDRYFLDEIATKILDLEDGELTIYHTNYSGFVREKEERLLIEFQQYEEQQKKIKKMKETIKRLREWANQANPPNAGLHRRASSMEKALERIEKLNRPVLNRKKMNIDLDATDRSGKEVIFMKDVSKSFGLKKLFEGVNLHIQYKDRIAIIGDNGTGKSTLLKMILNEVEADSGEVKRGSNVKIGYLSQHAYVGIVDETVIETFRDGVSVTEGEARHILARFLFYGHSVFRKVSQLSGGEKMRLRLAQLMYQDINFLVLDEPTNHLDIESREVLEEALEDYRGTILAVSHDRFFINRLFQKIYWIDQKHVHYFGGDYDWSWKKMNEQKQEENRERPKEKRTVSVHKPQEENHTKKMFELEQMIEAVEASLLKLEKQLEREKELAELQVLYTEKEKLEDEREKLYEQLEAWL
ncbi:ATPase subunit of ABC transporter with duplicated ATPase domains [Cytobacillus eiseniae]|uniref:ATPase subunit of ABC transporter with duplicated ATPase domains n=1 Tax=Cytobacillus eiseniae TaxID=762947 RepID=A0ABS4RGQ0_9BACI|nr:ABC-F type ribosomal protection protein [Cytobacillus eiseniae]MBP2241909.1 ATPase subunit of ABC transporter with duplicated ATPase domains [Cytobacillus eiseniae]